MRLFFTLVLLLGLGWRCGVLVAAAAAAATATAEKDETTTKNEVVVVTGKIISCNSGKCLKNNPELLSFLKDGEATFYNGVVVRYIGGDDEKDPVLHVIHNQDTLVEIINLKDIKTKVELHELMILKGFVKKSQSEIDELIRLNKLWNDAEDHVEQEMRREQREQREERKKRRLDNERKRREAREAGEEREMSEELQNRLKRRIEEMRDKKVVKEQEKDDEL